MNGRENTDFKDLVYAIELLQQRLRLEIKFMLCISHPKIHHLKSL
jgi:hypothetical protein